jgi:hypothetical protein
MPHLELIPWCFVDPYFGPRISVAHAKNHKQVNKVEKGIVLLSPHTKKSQTDQIEYRIRKYANV